MSDLPIQGLLQQHNSHKHSGEYLEVLGKHAASHWSSGDFKTLTESVTATVKQAQLSPEQVRRVVEFANTAAYLGEFKKEGATHHVVDFPGGPADPSEILKDLNDGGGGSVFDRGTGDYDSPPNERSEKTASAGDEQALASLFGTDSAAAALPYENPHAEVIDLKDKLAGAADHLHAQISSLEIMYADMADRLYHQVKQAALGGTSLGQVMQAWETVAPSEEHIKVAFTLLTPRLLRDGVFHSVDQMTASVDKTASARLVNQEHPLVADFGEFCQTLSKLAELREARTEIRGHLQDLQNYLKLAAGVGGMAGDVMRTAGRAGRAARPFLDAAVGETLGGVGQTAIHASPVLLAAAGANELNRHVENSPGPVASAARAVKHKALQVVPGTADYYRHGWEIQNGQ